MGHRSLSQLFNCAILVQKNPRAKCGKCKGHGQVQSLGQKGPPGGNWQCTPVLLLGKSHGQRSLEVCSPWARKESDTAQREHEHPCKSSLEEYINEQGCLCSNQNFIYRTGRLAIFGP